MHPPCIFCRTVLSNAYLAHAADLFMCCGQNAVSLLPQALASVLVGAQDGEVCATVEGSQEERVG
jgi:hypothetical protein